ncbi:hypothetical protein CDAR_34901 [Caerostris darwini]|uniref:Uncharacterized protein n=1 Tax=Caerostris darwini TaxID=1538125 RepID=A0AAV4MTH6_9ARAC|nr:hypothetical protein CDAR_34901 [Caerostris darwini]
MGCRTTPAKKRVVAKSEGVFGVINGGDTPNRLQTLLQPLCSKKAWPLGGWANNGVQNKPPQETSRCEQWGVFVVINGGATPKLKANRDNIAVTTITPAIVFQKGKAFEGGPNNGVENNPRKKQVVVNSGVSLW